MRTWLVLGSAVAVIGCAEPGGGRGTLDCARTPTAPVCRGSSATNEADGTANTEADTAAPPTVQETRDAQDPTHTEDVSEVSGTATLANDTAEPLDTFSPADTITPVDTVAPVDTIVSDPCDDAELTVSGEFELASPFAFNRVTVDMVHKRDVDAFEDGCIAEVKVALQRGAGCTLGITAKGTLSVDGALAITSVGFMADSQCPGFPDAAEGLYVDQSGELTVKRLELGSTHVPDTNATESCFATTLDIELEGVLRDGGGVALEIDNTHFRVAGVVRSEGSVGVACPCRTSCTVGSCGDDGCGGTCGECLPNERCEEGLCVEDPNLANCDGVCTVGDWLSCPNDCCGDGACDGFETFAGCPDDCSSGCGDFQCASGESGHCPFDCPVCGDGFCSSSEFIDCITDCLF